jgi:hypothetical protein
MAKMLNNMLCNVYKGNAVRFSVQMFNNMRKDLSTAESHRSGIQETIFECPPVDKNTVASS